MTEAPKWDLVYEKSNRPDEDDIADYIGNRLWEELNAYLRETYGVKPEITYSCCPAQRGWNVKYKKGGKALTTIYPERGFFIALVVIGPKEETATRQLLPVLHPHIRQLYNDIQPMTRDAG